MKEIGLFIFKTFIGILFFIGGHYLHGNFWGSIVIYFLGFMFMDIWCGLKSKAKY